MPPLAEKDANGERVENLLEITLKAQALLHYSLETSAIQSTFSKTLLRKFGHNALINRPVLHALTLPDATGLTVKN